MTRVLSVTTGLALALGLALVQPQTASAVTSSAKTEFIESLVSVAQKTQTKFGVPASVLIAQAIEATDWGTSTVLSKANNYFDTKCSATMTETQFHALANAQVGKPYVLGAEASISDSDPAKFDCSELVEWLYGRSGNPITDLAAYQYKVTDKVTSPKVGDLVFLRNNPARFNGIGHVAIITKKLSGGGWRIIEAKGSAYGVVRTTLKYWKTRSYYAGIRRYSSFSLASGDSTSASAAGLYKSGCKTISSTSYSTFASKTKSFYANAAAISSDSDYADAYAVVTNVSEFVEELAKVVKPNNSTAYAETLDDLIDTYDLTDYDVVDIDIVLESGDSGFRVTALQYLLKAAGYSVSVTGKYDSATVSAVKKFQKAKSLTVDGEAGQYTLTALFTKISSGASGMRPKALNALLEGVGYSSSGGNDFGSTTLESLQSFQTTAGRSVSSSVDDNTWAALFMALDSTMPSISGEAEVGETLTASAGTWGPGTVTKTYQWYRGGSEVSGADDKTYDVTTDDAGSKLSVKVTGVKTGYTMTARTSSSTDKVEDASFTTTSDPEVTGTAKVGKTLTAVKGTWKPTPSAFAYQWFRDGSKISGATASTYTAQADDEGAELSVSVTGSLDGYTSVTNTSDATDVIDTGTLSASTPTISGTAKVGKTLKATAGTWSPSGVELSYQWYRGATKIDGATSTSYELTSSDEDKKITVTVTGSLDGYDNLTKTSKATDTVDSGTLSLKGLSISGKKDVGSKLSVEQTWSPSGVTVTYQWYRGTVKLTNATKSTYTLTKASLGKKMSVKVTGKKDGYTKLVETSAKTRKVTMP